MNNIIVLNFLIIILNTFHANYAIFKITNGNTDDNVNAYRTYSDYRANMQLHTVKIFARENSKTLKGYSCSGSIVDYYWIITSAHCVYGFDVIDVFIGNVTNDLDHIVRVKNVFIHPEFDYDNEIINDIALLKLRRSLASLNNTFEIIALPTIYDSESEYIGFRGIIAGYGKFGDSGPTANFANYAYYEIIPLRECQNLFLNNYTEYSSMCLCGKGIGASSCQGDSGQGLIIYRRGEKKIVGVVSKGLESCETINEPEVFTRVDKYLDFIQEIIKSY
ncbi:unnamed protein product [Chironomus riparius]|uniref:Peptidase S1 domain-containing protein n=1 Tax=Chironomus riparius TaxID=315576 RepID=A0A9N9WLV6_9DIPT|nr:unnamed protein product [Chironomus riparius]